MFKNTSATSNFVNKYAIDAEATTAFAISHFRLEMKIKLQFDWRNVRVRIGLKIKYPYPSNTDYFSKCSTKSKINNVQ